MDVKYLNPERTQELINETKRRLGTKQDTIQVTTLPTASADYVGKVYQYIGVTGNGLTHNYFYECVSNGETPPIYSWQNVEVQEGGSDSVVNMTTAEFEAAVAAGTLPANSIICVTDETGEVRFIQVAVMPTASADELGHIYQYIGATTASYTNGYFYKCVSDGESTPTYSWEIAPTFGVDVSEKADKVTNATNGNFAGLDSSGNLTDSGKKASDFANATHTHTVSGITDFPTLGTAAAKDSTNAVTANSTDLVESGAVKTAIDAAIVSAYKAGGAKTCAELTSALLVAANEGYVYTISDTGTTTADFIEGAGKPIGIGADVGVILRDGAYKFNLLPGIIDTSNFVQKSQTAGLLKNDGTVDTTQYVSDISGKTDKVSNATNGNFAGLDANGNLTDSGKKASDFATSTQGGKADTAVQSITVGGTTQTKTDGVVALPAYPTTLPASDVYDWAKAATKPSYTASEVGAAAASHNQASNTINAMTGYSKPSTTSAIATTDTLNDAIGKLEKGLETAGGGAAVELIWSGSSVNTDISVSTMSQYKLFVFIGNSGSSAYNVIYGVADYSAISSPTSSNSAYKIIGPKYTDTSSQNIIMATCYRDTSNNLIKFYALSNTKRIYGIK